MFFLFSVPPVYLLIFPYMVWSEEIKGLKYKAIFANFKLFNIKIFLIAVAFKKLL